MKLTSIFFRNARAPQNEKRVPFKTNLSLKLKDYISSRNQSAVGMFLHKKNQFYNY